ncbi:MAG: hypothetical protein ACOH2L_16910 [Devosia sp.]
MRPNHILASAALAVALGFAGTASAATLVGGVTVTDIDLPKVQALCTQMADDASNAASADVAAPVNTDMQKPMGSKNIDDITMQDCVEAGLLPADTAMPATK